MSLSSISRPLGHFKLRKQHFMCVAHFIVVLVGASIARPSMTTYLHLIHHKWSPFPSKQRGRHCQITHFCVHIINTKYCISPTFYVVYHHALCVYNLSPWSYAIGSRFEILSLHFVPFQNDIASSTVGDGAFDVNAIPYKRWLPLEGRLRLWAVVRCFFYTSSTTSGPPSPQGEGK